jgi:hypothetical protein
VADPSKLEAITFQETLAIRSLCFTMKEVNNGTLEAKYQVYLDKLNALEAKRNGVMRTYGS